MSTNDTLMQKADWAVSDLNSNGGLLNPEQSNRFIRKLIEQPTLLRQARTVTMSAPQRNINKLQFANRIMKPATSGTALSQSDRSKPVTEQVNLNTKEVIAEVRLPYDVIEDNIERGNIGTHTEGGNPEADGGIKDTIMTLIAERAALDLEELALLGDTSSGDPYLALLDGYLQLATSNTVDAGTAAISKDVFKQMCQALPDQYMRNRAQMRHFASVDNEIAYRDTLADRETAMGDANIQGMNPVFAHGIRVEPASLMPETHVLMTNPMNLIWGVQRQIHVETDKDIKSREYIIVLTTRVDFQIEEPDATVKTINLG